jgi:hypothetical protein
MNLVCLPGSKHGYFHLGISEDSVTKFMQEIALFFINWIALHIILKLNKFYSIDMYPALIHSWNSIPKKLDRHTGGRRHHHKLLHVHGEE